MKVKTIDLVRLFLSYIKDPEKYANIIAVVDNEGNLSLYKDPQQSIKKSHE